MSSSEKFCLRWNDFESNISVAFRELREEKDFFGVTLACDDEEHVKAHKQFSYTNKHKKRYKYNIFKIYLDENIDITPNQSIEGKDFNKR